jgi:hypothetical protein
MHAPIMIVHTTLLHPHPVHYESSFVEAAEMMDWVFLAKWPLTTHACSWPALDATLQSRVHWKATSSCHLPEEIEHEVNYTKQQ